MKNINIVRFLDFPKKLKLLKKTDARAQLQFSMTIQSGAIFLKGTKFNNTSRNNWKPLFEVFSFSVLTICSVIDSE